MLTVAFGFLGVCTFCERFSFAKTANYAVTFSKPLSKFFERTFQTMTRRGQGKVISYG